MPVLAFSLGARCLKGHPRNPSTQAPNTLDPVETNRPHIAGGRVLQLYSTHCTIAAGCRQIQHRGPTQGALVSRVHPFSVGSPSDGHPRTSSSSPPLDGARELRHAVMAPAHWHSTKQVTC